MSDQPISQPPAATPPTSSPAGPNAGGPPVDGAVVREADASRVTAAPPRKLPLLLISLAVLALDQWTKHLVERHLPLHDPREIIPGLLNFSHVKNPGVAFGLFSSTGGSDGGPILLSLLGGVALVLVSLYFWKVPATDRLLLVALALVLGGAVGNLIDRVATGVVTDFVDFYVGSYHWHTFNLADSAITIGIGLMILDTILSQRRQPAAAEA